MKMTTAHRRRSRQPSTSCFVRLSRLPKVNPAKSSRASRASVTDLSNSEVTDRVSRLHQPSLVDTMASTARIAQGLKEDEEVEKTTLSETLNTSSSTFKHLTVKQVFPGETYRLKILERCPVCSETSAPASYQMSQLMCLDKDERTQRYRQGLRLLPISSCCAVMTCWRI